MSVTTTLSACNRPRSCSFVIASHPSRWRDIDNSPRLDVQTYTLAASEAANAVVVVIVTAGAVFAGHMESS